MDNAPSIAFGFLKFSGSISQLRELVRQMGFTPSEGDTRHVHIEEFEHVMFREYSKSEHRIEADAGTLEEMLSQVQQLTAACAENRIGYSIEVYDPEDNLHLRTER